MLRFLANRFPAATMGALFVLGILAWGAFNTAMEATNTETFCVSCHEMRDNVYPEYRDSVHYRNAAGVRATCPDCHVPKAWVHKLARKIRATNELYHAMVGSIDNREKFLSKREELAQIVWKTMRDTDSRECRNCHAYTYMDFDDQGPKAAVFHRFAEERGRTCIDCHAGIAHHLPNGYRNRVFERDLDEIHDRLKRDGTPCYSCHEDMAHADW